MGKMTKIEYFELKNGIRVVMVPLEGRKSVTVRVMTDSKYETETEAGLSHFLEHMAFKGTKKRPNPMDINLELDGKGARWNAETNFDYTAYYITSVAKNLDWMLDLLSDVLLNSIFREKEVEKERGVIVEEIRMYRDNPIMGLSGDFVDYLLADSPIGCWNIAGHEKTVSGFSRRAVVEFRDKYVDPKRMVVVIAGNINNFQFSIFNFQKLMEKYFGGFKSSGNKMPEVKMSFGDKADKVIKRQVEQGHFVLGGKGLSRREKEEMYVLRLLEVVAAENSSSRLHKAIREDRGWAYYVNSEFDCLREGGMWLVQSGVMQNKLDEAIELARRELRRIGDDLGPEELSRAKDYVLGTTGLSMDSSAFWASMAGKRMLLDNEVLDLEGELSKVSKVKLKQVKDLAKRLFCDQKMVLMKVTG